MGHYNGITMAREKQHPRQLKTHLQYRFFEKAFEKRKPKVIIAMRNLKVLEI